MTELCNVFGVKVHKMLKVESSNTGTERKTKGTEFMARWTTNDVPIDDVIVR